MERSPKNEARRTIVGAVVFTLIIGTIMVIMASGGVFGSKSSRMSKTDRSSYYNYEPGSNYRYVPQNSTGGSKAGTSRLFRYKCQTSKPIAKMSKKDLTAFLTRVYTEDF